MSKVKVLSKFKAQFCVLFIALALIIAGVCGVGLSARAETSNINPNDYGRELFVSETTYDSHEAAIAAISRGAACTDIEVVPLKCFSSNLYLGDLSTSAKYFSSSAGYFVLVSISFESEDFNCSDYKDFTLYANGASAFELFSIENNQGYFFVYVVRSAIGDDYVAGSIDSDLFSHCIMKCAYDGTVTPLPEEPTKEGYTFAGWYYGTDEEHSKNCVRYNADSIYGDTALHAHWDINKYTVKYNSNGGTAVETATVEWNTAAPLPTPTRTGYNFVGWYTSDGVQYNGEAIKDKMTLIAHWDIKTFNVKFYVDGEEYKSITVEYGTTLQKAMQQAKVASYAATDMNGAAVSKTSVITDTESVLLHKLTKAEKVGNYLGTHAWLLWLILVFGCAVTITAVVSTIVAVKRR